MEEETPQELSHPLPEPDSAPLKHKVNHKCVVAYLKKEKLYLKMKREKAVVIIFLPLFADPLFGLLRIDVVHRLPRHKIPLLFFSYVDAASSLFLGILVELEMNSVLCFFFCF